MAVKTEHVLASACLFILLLNNCSYISCTTSTVAETSTTTEAVTTESLTTTEAETTVTTTTQAPTTTTTPLPTLPPTIVASVTDISPCPCDLTGNACDVNCCCDLDCTSADRDVFTECLPSAGNVDDRLCVQKEILLLENAPFSKNFTQDGLFCIYFDNYAERNYYNTPNLITDTTTFNDYVDTYAGPSYTTTLTGQSTISNYYRAGDPVYIVYETLATGFLGLPKALTSTACSDVSPVAYLNNEESSCVRQATTLDQTTCEGTTAFNAQSYYTGFRVVTSPYLFIYVVNGTVITTTPSTTVTTTTPIVTTDNSTNVTLPATTTTTTPAAVTFPDNSTNITTTETITTTVIIETTEPPTTVPPQQINLYNNTYTIDIGLSSVECRDTNNNPVDCGFTSGSVGSPVYTGGATPTCSNVVKEVEYTITHDGTNGITSTNVTFVLQTITAANLPLTQTYKSSFRNVNDVNVTNWSGNPGYMVGKPVRAGIRYLNESFGNRNIIVENSYNLTVVKSSATGSCLTDANNRVQVNFGQEMRSGCLLRINLDNYTLAEYCSAMQDEIRIALEGNSDFLNVIPTFNRYAATFGNSELEQTGDWVPILQVGPTATTSSQTLDGPTCLLSMGMNIQIVYSNVGSIANPQAKILGVAFNYEDQQTITYTCSGTACTPGNSNVDQAFEISQSVSFIDASQPATGAVGDAPIFIAKVPNDFFYPFATGSGNSIRVQYTLFVGVLLCVFSTLFVSL